MYTLIEELQECIFRNEKYKEYIKAKNELNKEEVYQLLLKYQDVQHEYFKMKEYEKYNDMTSIKKEYQKMKKEISQNQQIQDYYLKYYEINELLDEITEIIFDGISEDLHIDRYSL